MSLFDFIPTCKPHYSEIPVRSTSHVSREGAVLDLIALRKHDTQRLLLSCEKKSISNLHVVRFPDNLNFFLSMQFYRSVACDSRAFLTAKCTLPVLFCSFVCLILLIVVCFGSTHFPRPDIT